MTSPPNLDLTATIRDAASMQEHSPAGVSPPPRYVVGEELGRGVTGLVYEAYDSVLDRQVALKLLAATGGRRAELFLREARITASLDHPNIVPIYDLQVDGDGQASLSMRRIVGRSLGSAISLTMSGQSIEGVGSPAEVVSVFIKVCDALARAHSRGIVHRDIKPDNIMLGLYGEVQVVDWGEALVLGESVPSRSGLVGTPYFMSPEQARGEPADRRSDVYALGTAMFQALFRRVPIHEDAADAFWARKRSGDVSWPTPAEELVVGRQLMAVLRKALDPLPEQRYADASELGAELGRYQRGLSLRAYQAGIVERAGVWLRLHALSTVAVAAGLALVLAAGWYVYGERMRQVARWGDPLVAESFRDDGWRLRWEEVVPGTWDPRPGLMVSRGGYDSRLRLKRTLNPQLAVEYDAEMLPNAVPGDLSIQWLIDGPDDGKPQAGWAIKAGAFQNSHCAILRLPSNEFVAFSPLHLEPGRRYRFRAEIDGRNLSLSIDGRRLLSFSDDITTVGNGHLELYAYHPGKAFSDVRVYNRQPAELVSVLAVGEADFADGRFASAERRWGQVADTMRSGDLGHEARYLEGLAAFRDQRAEHALALWSALPTGNWNDRAEIHRLDHAAATGWDPTISARFTALHRRAPQLATLLSNLWQGWAQRWNRTPGEASEAVCAQLIALRRACMESDQASAMISAAMLVRLDRSEELLSDPAVLPRERCVALLALGRCREVADSPDALTLERGEAMVELGEVDNALAIDGLESGRRAVLLLMSGRYLQSDVATVQRDSLYAYIARGEVEQALVKLPGAVRNRPLLALAGRWQEAADPAGVTTIPCEALYRLGRWDEGFLTDFEPRHRQQARWLQAIEGGKADAAELGEEIRRSQLGRHWFLPLFAIPLQQELSGNAGAWRRGLSAAQGLDARFARRAWHLARYCDGIDTVQELLAQPMRAEAEAWRMLGDAMIADVQRDTASALAAWKGFLALPGYKRRLAAPWPDPLIERFAEWRISLLTGDGAQR